MRMVAGIASLLFLIIYIASGMPLYLSTVVITFAGQELVSKELAAYLLTVIPIVALPAFTAYLFWLDVKEEKEEIFKRLDKEGDS